MAAAQLLMNSPSASHRPVLVSETLEVLAPEAGALLLDGTVGLGGHAEGWLARSGPAGRVIGLDRDHDALRVARERLQPFGSRFTAVHADYRSAAQALDELGIESVQAALLDLGLGSHQLDDASRGFSFRFDAPLDMRFDRSALIPTAAELIARLSEPDLAAVLHEYGEERAARKLARRIVEERRHRPISTTLQLAELVRSAIPASRHDRIDPATRTFQALRIAVNRELEGLDAAIVALIDRLEPGGRIAVISFHSLEDRIVKHTLRRLAEPCRCRRGDPCNCGAIESIELIQRRAISCSPEEAALNPRARSARLRFAVKR